MFCPSGHLINGTGGLGKASGQMVSEFHPQLPPEEQFPGSALQSLGSGAERPECA